MISFSESCRPALNYNVSSKMQMKNQFYKKTLNRIVYAVKHIYFLS